MFHVYQFTIKSSCHTSTEAHRLVNVAEGCITTVSHQASLIGVTEVGVDIRKKLSALRDGTIGFGADFHSPAKSCYAASI